MVCVCVNLSCLCQFVLYSKTNFVYIIIVIAFASFVVCVCECVYYRIPVYSTNPRYFGSQTNHEKISYREKVKNRKECIEKGQRIHKHVVTFHTPPPLTAVPRPYLLLLRISLTRFPLRLLHSLLSVLCVFCIVCAYTKWRNRGGAATCERWRT